MKGNRIDECNKVKGCYFKYIDKNGYGECKEIQIRSKDTLLLNTPKNIYSLLVTKNSNDISVTIEGIMKERFTSSVADSIEKSHEAVHEVAKELVLDVLQNVENVDNVGTILSHIFADESVLLSTRMLAYFYLHTDATFDCIMWQLKWLRFYYCRGGGKVYSLIELINQFLIWSQQDAFHHLVTSLLINTLQHQESVITPLSKIVAKSILSAQSNSSTGLQWAAAGFLKSDTSKEFAKSYVSTFLKKKMTHQEEGETKDNNEKEEQDNVNVNQIEEVNDQIELDVKKEEKESIS